MGGPEMQEDYTYILTTCIVLLVVVCKHAKMASVQNDGLTLPKIHVRQLKTVWTHITKGLLISSTTI